MKISIEWLSQYVDFDLTVEQIGDILSDRGFPVEGIEQFGDDFVLDLEVTSNRGDCLSHIGLAREVAAATGKELKIPAIELVESDRDISEFCSVEIDATDLCSRYTARVITGVTVGQSPDWMVRRLESIGVRSVNNVVDATNYAMLEIGQPPHAFDYETLQGGKIVIRKAIAGERIVSIDGTKCDLKENMLVIADAKRPVAIAGVMGGLETEVSEATTTILLEEAQFDPVTVRTAGRGLAISSEASFRFERQVDTENISWASRRTAALIIEVAGGKVIKGVADAYPGKAEQQRVAMRFSRLNSLIGIDIAKDDVVAIFASLGFDPEVRDDDVIVATVPSWRHDIYREVDLIEEVIRCYGFDKIPVEPKLNIEVAKPDIREKLSCSLRNYLSGCGYYETINITFVDSATADLFAPAGTEHLSVKDETRKSANLLRENLIGSLMNVYKSNYNAKNLPCSIYELADTFAASKDSDLPIERVKLGLVCDSGLRKMRGVIEGIVGLVDKSVTIELVPAELPWASAGADVMAAGVKIGQCGIVSEKVAKFYGVEDTEVCAGQIDFNMLLDMQGAVVKVKMIPRFPAVTRDLSLIVDESVRWSDICDAVNTKAPDMLEQIDFAGIYRGKPIENGKKSVTVSLRFRDDDGTLTHEVVDTFESEILEELSKELKAVLRTA